MHAVAPRSTTKSPEGNIINTFQSLYRFYPGSVCTWLAVKLEDKLLTL